MLRSLLTGLFCERTEWATSARQQMNKPDRGVEFAAEDEEFCGFVAKHFDPEYYLQTYSDVASTGLSPLQHWLSHGFREGRQFSRLVPVRLGTIARRSADRNWKLFCWRETDIALRVLPPVARDVISQILNQGRHDPAVLAPGIDTIKNLVPSDRENIHLNVAGLQQAIHPGAEFLVIVPSSEIEQGVTIDLIAALSDPAFGPVQTIITEQESSQAGGQLTVPNCLQRTQPVFWRDFWVEGPENVKLYQLAQLIRVLRPRVTIVAGSRHGFEVVARYGGALSERSTLYCLYSGIAQGCDFAAQYLHRTLSFATALTDDEMLAADWRERYGDLFGHAVVTLPHHSPASFLDTIITLFNR